MSLILQSQLPMTPWMDDRTARLPGVQPLQGDDWTLVDDAFAGQMALRDRLIAEKPLVVLAELPRCHDAAQELYSLVLTRLRQNPLYDVSAHSVLRPDGVRVDLDPAAALATLGRLVQEDLCLMEKTGDEHVLTGACLCFPASWALSEKLGRPLTGIHHTVKSYDADITKRVQRLFDMIRPDQPLWRMNALVYVNPDLHQPGFEGAPRTDRRNGQFVRAERQTLLRLPETGAVLFAIHTYVVRLETLSQAAQAGLQTARL